MEWKGRTGALKGWGATAGALLPCAILLGAWLRLQPPAPEPVSTSADTFSAVRAMETLNRLLPEAAPHPTGSPEQQRVRERLLALLRELGYAPEVQQAESCGPLGICAGISNVLAELPGRSSGPAVLLTAHYDSVPASPGIADDGSGVAVMLEVARALKQGPAPERSVIFLFSDGEELGLLGARAFVERHALAARVGQVVNLDARGVSGPSLLFEVGDTQGPELEQVLEALERPVASSAFTTVYELLGSDTDFSVYRQRGLGGFNFAFVGGARRYHSHGDRPEALSLETLQHHGSHALAAVRTLSREAASAQGPSSKRVFTDIASLGVIGLPADVVPGLAWALAVAWGALAFLSLRGGRASPRAVGYGLLAQLSTWVLAVGGGTALVAFLWWRVGVPPRGSLLDYQGEWLGASSLALTAFAALAWGALLLVAEVLSSRLEGGSMFLAAWAPWALVPALLLGALPGVAFPFVLATASAMGVMALALAARWGPLCSLIPSGIACVLLFPTVSLVHDALGFLALPLYAFLVALGAGTALPAMAMMPRLHRRALAGAAGLVLVACTAAMALPGEAQWSWPRKGSAHVHVDAGARQAWCYEEVERSTHEPSTLARQVSHPWWPYGARGFRELSMTAVPAPELTVEQTREDAQGLRHITATVRSPRRADSVMLLFPPSARVESVRLNGQAAWVTGYMEPPPAPGWTRFVYEGLHDKALRLELVLGDAAPTELHLVDRSHGAPPEDPCRTALRAQAYLPGGDGDLLLVSTRIRL